MPRGGMLRTWLLLLSVLPRSLALRLSHHARPSSGWPRARALACSDSSAELSRIELVISGERTRVAVERAATTLARDSGEWLHAGRKMVPCSEVSARFGLDVVHSKALARLLEHDAPKLLRLRRSDHTGSPAGLVMLAEDAAAASARLVAGEPMTLELLVERLETIPQKGDGYGDDVPPSGRPEGGGFLVTKGTAKAAVGGAERRRSRGLVPPTSERHLLSTRSRAVRRGTDVVRNRPGAGDPNAAVVPRHYVNSGLGVRAHGLGARSRPGARPGRK